MKFTTIGFPSIGENLERIQAEKAFLVSEIDENELAGKAVRLIRKQAHELDEAGVCLVPVNDFTFGDLMLDLIWMLQALPEEFCEAAAWNQKTDLAAYVHLADKGTERNELLQENWYGTMEERVLPVLDESVNLHLKNDDFLKPYRFLKSEGLETAPVLIGPFTFLSKAVYPGWKKAENFAQDVIKAYQDMLSFANDAGVQQMMFVEPALCTDLDEQHKELFLQLYEGILPAKKNVKVIVQTSFGDVRDVYCDLIRLDVDGIGLDFVSGKKNLTLVEEYGFPEDKTLYAGVISGLQIWKSDYAKVLKLVRSLMNHASSMVLQPSCSLSHVPYSFEQEADIPYDLRALLCGAKEKMQELKEIAMLADERLYRQNPLFLANQDQIMQSLSQARQAGGRTSFRLSHLNRRDFVRKAEQALRKKAQKDLPESTADCGQDCLYDDPQFLALCAHLYESDERIPAIREELHEQIWSFCRRQNQMDDPQVSFGCLPLETLQKRLSHCLSGLVSTRQGWVQTAAMKVEKPPVLYNLPEQTKNWLSPEQHMLCEVHNKPVCAKIYGPAALLSAFFSRASGSLAMHMSLLLAMALILQEELLSLEKAGVRIVEIHEPVFGSLRNLRKSERAGSMALCAMAIRLAIAPLHVRTRVRIVVHTHGFKELWSALQTMEADQICLEHDDLPSFADLVEFVTSDHQDQTPAAMRLSQASGTGSDCLQAD